MEQKLTHIIKSIQLYIKNNKEISEEFKSLTKTVSKACFDSDSPYFSFKTDVLKSHLLPSKNKIDGMTFARNETKTFFVSKGNAEVFQISTIYHECTITHEGNKTFVYNDCLTNYFFIVSNGEKTIDLKELNLNTNAIDASLKNINDSKIDYFVDFYFPGNNRDTYFKGKNQIVTKDYRIYGKLSDTPVSVTINPNQITAVALQASFAHDNPDLVYHKGAMEDYLSRTTPEHRKKFTSSQQDVYIFVPECYLKN